MKQKRLMTVVLLVLIVLASVMAFVGCKKYKIPDEAYTEYYYEDGGMTKGFILTQEGFTLKEISGDKTGTYTFNKKNGEFTFTLEGKEMTGTYADGTLTLKADGNTYVCKKGKIYKVTYKAEGTTGVPSKYIAENAVLTEPPQPTKAGQIFTGWYADGGFKVPYKFGVAVKGDVTIYAKFVDPALATYTVSFEGSKNPIKPQTTNKAGIIENLPTAVQDGKEFIGWWMSDYEDATKLTCQYTDQAIGQNLTLFAVFKDSTPAVSIDSETVRWENKGLSVSYKVTIYDSNNNKLLDNTFTGVYETRHNLADKPAGEYRVEVVLNNGSKGTAYYRNKALDRVSIFKINTENDFMLEFEPVRNAETYIVTVECGNETHEHIAQYTDQEIGYRTYFDFSDCEMRESGINFTVKAAARGYLTSASAKFNLNRRLDAVSKLSVNDNEEITFENVAHAKAYAVSINGGDYVALSSIGSLKEYAAGEIKIKIRATAKGYNPSESEEFVYTKTKIATPKNSTFEVKGDALTWEKIEGATKYIVKIGDKEYETSTNSLPFSQVTLTGEAVEVSIKAVSSNTANDSLYSDVVTFSPSLKDKVTYSNNTVRWAIVFGATEYEVILNGKSMGKINGISKEITLTQKENEIEVVYYNKATAMGSEKITVKAYEIVMYTNFEPNAIYTKAYAAVGDKIAFATGVTRLGYTFRHWSDTTGGTEYSNTTLETAQDLKLYAQWTANKYNVTLSFEGGVMDGESTVEVTFDSNFVFPVPKDKNNVMAFAGWMDVDGKLLTDYTGKGIDNWTTPKETTLLAKWVDVFEFYKLANGNYSITTTYDGIKYLSEVTVPSMYDGKLVEIIEGGAFSNVTTMKVVNIPDTVQYIETGINGINNAGSAFYSCTNLTDINVYYAIGNHERMYASCDGVLYHKKGQSTDGETVYAELKGYTPAREALTYTIPSTFDVKIGEAESAVQKATWKVTSIGRRGFFMVKLNELFIPSTVTTITTYSICFNYNITKIEFLDAKAGETAENLVIEEKGIHYIPELTKLVLPSRLTDFDYTRITSCYYISEVTFADDSGEYMAKDNMVCSDRGTRLVWIPQGTSKDVKIPIGIKTIGERVFAGYYDVTSVTIPEWLEVIEPYAFYNCYRMTSLTFEGNATSPKLSLANYSFYNCYALKEVELSPNVQEIGAYAFGHTLSLSKVTVKSVGETAEGETVPALAFADYAFAEKTAQGEYKYYVTELTIGKDVPTFSIPSVFGDRINNITIEDGSNYFELQDKVIFDKGKAEKTLIYLPKGVTGAYTVPDTVDKIGPSAALNHSGLTEIDIGNNVTEIGEKAFYGCSQLAKVTFKATSKVEKFGNEAFANCTSLRSITLPASLTTLEESGDTVKVFDGCNVLNEVNVDSGSTKFTSQAGILYGLTEGSITELCFIPKNYSANDGKLTIPATVSKVWSGAFYNTTGLKTVEFEAGSKIIFTERMFYRCYSLEEVVLPKGLLTIPKYAFTECPKLNKVVIPNTVVNIGQFAFDGLTSLTNIEFERADETNKGTLIMDANALNGLPSLTTLTLSDRLINVSTKLVYMCTALQTVNVPASVETINDYAFSCYISLSDNKTSLVTVNIEDVDKPIYESETAGKASKLKTLKTNAFNYNTLLKNINLPDSITTIEKFALSNNNAIERLSLPENLNLTAGNEFSNMTALISVEFRGEKVKTITNNAFANCSKLETITLPPSVTTVKASAFNNCTSLKSVLIDVYPEGHAKAGKSDLNNLDKNSFKGCTALETLGLKQYATDENPQNVLPDGFKTLSDQALTGLTSLKSIVLPASINKIGKSAFDGSGIEKIEFKTYTDGAKANKCDLNSIGDNAFANTKLTSFVFPESASASGITIGKMLFKGTFSLNSITYSNSVKIFAGELVNGARNVTEIVFPSGYADFTQNEGIIYNAAGDKIVYVYQKLTNSEYVVPAHVTEISAYAFKNQTNLKKVYIPNTVQRIGNGAFFNNFALEEVFFYKTKDDGTGKFVADLDENGNYQSDKVNNLDTIGQAAFAYCKSLKDFAIPTSVKTISDDAFYYCTSLGKNATEQKPFVVPAAETFGKRVFYGSGLTYVKFEGNFNETKWGAYIFAYTFSLKKAYLNAVENQITAIPAQMFYYSGISQIDLTGIATVGTSVFAYSELTELIIPSTAASFDRCAFGYMKKLTKVTFEKNDGLKALNAEMFIECSSLTTVDITGLTALTFMGTSTFRLSGITSITLPETVIHLGSKADRPAGEYDSCTVFSECKQLTTVVLPSKIETIGGGAFKDCPNLVSVTYAGYQGDKDKVVLPSTVRVLGLALFSKSGIKTADLSQVSETAFISNSIFNHCKQLTSVEFNPNITAYPTAIFYGCESIKEFDFSKYRKVMKISNNMFMQSGIESAVIPEGVTAIGLGAFKESAIKKVTLPSSVKSIGSGAFQGSQIMAVNLSYVTTIEDNLFNGCKNLTTVSLNDNISKLPTSVFEACESLKQIELPLALTEIGKNAFKGSGLESIVLTDNLTQIGESAFENSALLKSVIFDSKIVKTIGNNAFANCASLEEMTLPESVATIGEYAFLNTAIKSGYIPTNVAVLGSGAFSGCKQITKFEVSPDNPVYKTTAEGLLLDVNDMLIAYPAGKTTFDLTGVETIGKGLFAGTAFTEIVVPSAVKKIEDNAFASSRHLQKVSFEEGSQLTYLGKSVFYDSTALETVDFTNATQLTKFEDNAFTYSYIRSIVIPESVTTFGRSAFAESPLLTSVTFKGNVKMDAYAFYSCVSLKTVIFEKPIERIERATFQLCKSLKTITLPEGLKGIETNAFKDAGLTEITLPKSLETVGENAFSNCVDLATITIPADGNLKTIENSAFKSSGITSIKLPASLRSIGKSAFEGCAQLADIEFDEPTDILSIGKTAFKNCVSANIYITKNITFISDSVFYGWTEKQTVYVIGIKESDVAENWYGTFTDLLDTTWQTGCNAKIMWNYTKQ